MKKWDEQKPFGAQIKISAYLCAGAISEDLFVQVNSEVVSAIGMNNDNLKPAIWKYPLNGKGGIGITQVFPWVESFMTFDSYNDLELVYIFVVSCKWFDEHLLTRLLSKHYDIVDSKHFILGS